MCAFFHDLINVTYKIKIQPHLNRNICARDFRSFNINDFHDDLTACDWNSLLTAHDVNVKINILNNFLLGCYNNHAPYRNIKPKHLSAPWLSEEIRAKMKERNRARREWRRRRCEAGYKTYRVLRNRVQEMVRAAKGDYYFKTFNNSNDPNDIWRKLRHLGLIKSKSSNARLLFTIEELNEHFAHSSSSAGAGEEPEHIYLGDQTYDNSKLYWYNIEPQIVVRELSRNKSNSVGIDCITPRLVSLALPCILPFVTHIFNYCLTNSVFPNVWKSALICRLSKIKCPSNMQHYRPISILCMISKALERLVAERITEHLETFDLLDPHQAAYRKGHSTQKALIKVMDHIRQAADHRRVTIAVFFDFTKAFDNVTHHILINKLSQLSFPLHL